MVYDTWNRDSHTDGSLSSNDIAVGQMFPTFSHVSDEAPWTQCQSYINFGALKTVSTMRKYDMLIPTDSVKKCLFDHASYVKVNYYGTM